MTRLTLSDVLPVRCSHEGVGRSNNGGWAEVSQFDLTWLCQQDVSCLHVPERQRERNNHIRENDWSGKDKSKNKGQTWARKCIKMCCCRVCFEDKQRCISSSEAAQFVLSPPVFVLSLVRRSVEVEESRIDPDSENRDGGYLWIMLWEWRYTNPCNAPWVMAAISTSWRGFLCTGRREVLRDVRLRLKCVINSPSVLITPLSLLFPTYLLRGQKRSPGSTPSPAGRHTEGELNCVLF